MGLAVDDRFLLISEVQRMTSYKKTRIYELMDAGDFPKHHRIGANRVVWLESDVRGWMNRRLAAAA